ncbi:hypothetical protein BFF78_16665 [Streptomyces fodineus]|uniref:Uncharacterized protein n=1 Tax=Streptomyces fodineus TaxID=1904616 RepID=A0A1D7YAW8_9ACTN|nr:hypothetical protein [Streptomyces fodineus]AOR32479.1 hypothetical protein BFF78_16665 [Streptomyces fodineus]
MGERHSGDGPFGRRHVHPGGTLSAPDHTDGGRTGSGFEARLGAVLREGTVDAEAERRAVAAFRAAQATGAPRPRTRRRDDWRPAAPRRARLSLKTTLSVVLASLTLGGVAVAAIGSARSGAHGHPDGPRSAHPTSGSHSTAAPGPSATSGGPGSGAPAGRPDHPASARDTVAHCRTYERAGERGGALDSTAWQRLVTAAGGEDEVAAYCAAQVTSAQEKKSGKSGKVHAKGQRSSSGKHADSGGNSARKATRKKQPQK